MAVAPLSLEDLRSAGLADVDPDVADLLARELERQRGEIELIASENFTWPAMLEAVGSIATNKYSEGYPGRRYYGGCEVVDEIEQLAIDRAKALFGAEHANVQPHAGAQTNMAVYFSCLDPGDTILSLELSHGGTSRTGSGSTSRAACTGSSITASPARRTSSTTTRCCGSRRSTGPS